VTGISNALGPVFVLILFGALLRRLRFPGETFWPQAERVTYYVLFPALLINRLANAEIGNTPLLPNLGSIAFMLLAGSALIYLLRQQLSSDGPALTSVYQGGVRINTYIGLACADALYGDAGLVIAAVVVAIMIPLVNLFCILAFHLILHRGNLALPAINRSLLTNPLILGCLIGIALNQTGVGLPGWSDDTLALLGSAALPLGLLSVGVALQIHHIRHTFRELVGAGILRFVLMPVLMLLALHWLDLPPLNARVLLLFAILPTASSAYILARQLGGDTVLMANIITVQTLAGFVLIPAWLLITPSLL
jgi:predicted permease